MVPTTGGASIPNAPRSFSSRHYYAQQHRAFLKNRMISTSLYGNDEKDSIDIYNTVEEQDPEWYREFVVNVLGEDLPSSDELVGNPSTKASNVDCKVTTDESSDAHDELSSRLLSDRISTSVLEQDDTTDTDDFRKSEVTNCTVPKHSHEKASLTVEVNTTVSSVSGGTLVDSAETKPSVILKLDADETLAITTEEMNTKVASNGSMGTEGVDSVDNNISMAVSQRRTGTKTSPSSKRSRSSSSMKEIERKQQGPLNYETSPAPAVKSSPREHASFSMKSNTTKTTSPPLEKPLSSPGEPYRAQSRLSVKYAPPKESVEMGTNESEKDKYMIVYRDLYSGSLRAENLTFVTDLGYNTSEIPYLQPDVLGLIIQDKIRKPSRGLPQQWLISQSQYQVLSGDIQIVSKKEAQEMLRETHRKKSNVSKERKYSSKDSEPDDNDSKPRSDVAAKIPLTKKSRPDQAGQPRSTETTRRYDRKRRRRLEERPVNRERRTRSRLEKKRIFNAREGKEPRKQAIRGDPPPPDSPLWVDIQTFRELLRSEAELRVRILGEDWADIVKDESEWRLSLYTEWLWLLDRGIQSSNPLVPRRSNRARVQSPSRRPRARVKDSTKSQKSAASQHSDGPPRRRVRRSENYVNVDSERRTTPKG